MTETIFLGIIICLTIFLGLIISSNDEKTLWELAKDLQLELLMLSFLLGFC